MNFRIDKYRILLYNTKQYRILNVKSFRNLFAADIWLCANP